MGEGGAAMGLLDKLFRHPQTFTCGDQVSVDKIKEDQAKIRVRLDSVRATLNGEEGWFLSLQKHDSGERS